MQSWVTCQLHLTIRKRVTITVNSRLSCLKYSTRWRKRMSHILSRVEDEHEMFFRILAISLEGFSQSARYMIEKIKNSLVCALYLLHRAGILSTAHTSTSSSSPASVSEGTSASSSSSSYKKTNAATVL